MRILYLDLDALNPTHLGCYGYHRNTSPTIDKIAAEGIRFNQVYTTDAPCLPSRTAFYSGQFGIHSGIVGHGGTASERRINGPNRGFRDRLANEGLAGFLQRQGFKTSMISPFGQRHAAWHFYAGFNEIHNTGKGGMESAEEVTPVVEKWLQDNAADDNWFLHINYWDVHTPYRAPAEYGEPFADDPLPAWLTPELLEEHKKLVGPHTAQDIMMWNDRPNPRFPRHPGRLDNMDDLRRMIDGYDTAIRYVDDQIAIIVEILENKGVLDDTAIIISADHGENMGELGIYGEHGTADQATCHIPMIVKWPGGQSGITDEGLHYNIDLAPTLSDLLGGQKQALWDGESYAPVITEGTDAGRSELILSQCAHVCQRAVRFDDWIYIRTYHDGYRLYPRELLFNLSDDPYEMRDVAAENPNICREAAYRLMNWHDHMMETMPRPYDNDPLWTVMQEGGPMHTWGAFEDYCDRLAETGRAEGAVLLREKFGNKYRHP